MDSYFPSGKTFNQKMLSWFDHVQYNTKTGRQTDRQTDSQTVFI